MLKRWSRDRRLYIPDVHEPGEQPGFGMGKKGLKKAAKSREDERKRKRR